MSSPSSNKQTTKFAEESSSLYYADQDPTTASPGHLAINKRARPPYSASASASTSEPPPLTAAQRQELDKHNEFLQGTAESRTPKSIKGGFEECVYAPLFAGVVYTQTPASVFSQYGLLASLQAGIATTGVEPVPTGAHGQPHTMRCQSGMMSSGNSAVGAISTPVVTVPGPAGTVPGPVEGERSRVKTPRTVLRPASDALDPQYDSSYGDAQDIVDSRLFLNISAPWSAFICGVQGSGKSHTLSCMLESCLTSGLETTLPRPLAGLVFHYDAFTSFGATQVCEAAYLCSARIPVKVLVSPTNYHGLKAVYEQLPGIPADAQPEVIPLRFLDSQLNVARMMKLMAVSDKEGPLPLYIEVIQRILRDMAIEGCGTTGGLDYKAFRRRLDAEGFSGMQNQPLKLRLELLESFMAGASPSAKQKSELKEARRAWHFPPGTLTIIDLSCPFVDANAACALFNIALELFLSERGSGCVVALDEAHKFLQGSPAALEFTQSLLQVVRLQRHLATRVIIATQEPGIAPELLDLCSLTIVHRFASPAWWKAIRGHLAGAAVEGDGGTQKDEVFRRIVELRTGEALVFCPTAVLGVERSVEMGSVIKMLKLGIGYLQIRVRSRVSADGGKSIMAN